MSKSPIEMVENMIGGLMRQLKIPGLSIGIVINGKPTYAQGFGARNLENNLPMTHDTLFGIASMSKSFCALAILQLQEQGKIELDAPVSNYIDFKLGNKDNPIKVHHLLCHSSGLPELDATHAANDKNSFIPMSSNKDFLLFINRATSEQYDAPGNVFMYNNDMYTCLGLIVEKVSNMKYEDYIRENILKPFEMKRSTYLKENFMNNDNVISGYFLSKDGKSMDKHELKTDPLDYACGGLYSSVRELQNYMIGLMNEGTFNNNQIIQKSSLNKMWTSYITPPERYGKGYGYGFSVNNDFFGYTLVGHGGSIATSGGYFAMIPEKKMGVVIGQIPIPSVAPKAIVNGILATLLGKDENEAIPILNAHKKLQLILGKYKTYGSAQMEISLQEGGFLQATIVFSDQYPPMIFPLVVEDLENLKFSIPFSLPGMKMTAQGTIDEKTGKIHFQADRYFFHKIS